MTPLDSISRKPSSWLAHHLHRKYKTRQMAGKYFSVEMVEIESTSELGSHVESTVRRRFFDLKLLSQEMTKQ